MIAAAVLITFGFAGVVYADLNVQKTATCVGPEGTTELNKIPVGVVITCTFTITVSATNGHLITDVVVKDTVASDLEVNRGSLNPRDICVASP